MPANKFYAHALARIHALGFASMWDAATDWLVELARDSGMPPFLADIGCGDGRMLARFQDRGIEGWGCDISPDFVAMAKERGLNVVQGHAAKVALPKASLVTALGEVLCYKDESGFSSFNAFLAKAAAALPQGGAFVFDLIGPDIAPATGWRSEGDWFVASRAEVNGQELRREIVSFSLENGVWSREEEFHRLEIFDPAFVEARLREQGFEYEALDIIGGAPLLPGRIAYLARKEK